MKFYIFNQNYFITSGDKTRTAYPSNFLKALPWIVVDPNGKIFEEATHKDAITRMNIIINSVPA